MPIILRYEYPHRTICFICQVDTYTLQGVDSVVILILLVTLLLGAHGWKASRLWPPHFQAGFPSPDHPLLRESATPLGHPPASYNQPQKHQHNKAQHQASITLNVLQNGPGLIVLEDEYDDNIIHSPIRQCLRRTYASFWLSAACHRMTSEISYARVGSRCLFLLKQGAHTKHNRWYPTIPLRFFLSTSPSPCCRLDFVGY